MWPAPINPSVFMRPPESILRQPVLRHAIALTGRYGHTEPSRCLDFVPKSALFERELLPQDDPISRPVTNTRTPPRPTCRAAVSGGVSMYRCRIQLMAASSTRTTAVATTSAA